MNKVLIVEDNKSIREQIASLLTKEGLSVKLASDGKEALTILKKYIPDIVVLDIVMPNINGYQVCREIKSNEKTKKVPVIICSCKTEDFDRYWGMKQGADAYINKPFQAEELKGTIKQLLKGVNNNVN